MTYGDDAFFPHLKSNVKLCKWESDQKGEFRPQAKTLTDINAELSRGSFSGKAAF